MLLYFHIPFCESKCYYCSFFSQKMDKTIIKHYFDALKSHFLFEIDRLKIDYGQIETLYFGGGTPSLIDLNHYEKLFLVLKPYLSKEVEFSIETNPNSLNYDWLIGLKSLGLNRISIGVQSFETKKLNFLGRSHNKDDAIKAVELAFKVGIKNISVDLIYESALDNLKSLKKELEIAISLPINHISAYSLSIEDGSKFENRFECAKKDESQAYFLRDFLKDNGFNQYEVSNFGKVCKHNLGYWEYKEYIGIGSGAVGFSNLVRRYVIKSVDSYIKNPLQFELEELSSNQIKLEKIFLGLRSIVGFDIDLLSEIELNRLNVLEDKKKVVCKNGRVYSNELFLADAITLFLLQ